MTTPHDGSGRRPGARQARRPLPTERPPRHAAEPPRPALADQPGARRRTGRAPQAAAEPDGSRPGEAQAAQPAERRRRPPARRRRSPNDGVPADESPTEILDLGFDYDDRHDADEAGGDDFREDEERSASALLGDAHDDEDDDPPAERTSARRGKRFLGWLAALTVIVLLGGGAYYGARELLGFGYEDYAGAGERDVLLEVEEGDSTRAIAGKLRDLDVVASSEAFVSASEDDGRVLGIQPGYYVVKTKMSGADAVGALVEPQSRVGELQLRAGTQLDDINQPDGKVTPGVFALLSNASCADLNGESTCIPVERLREVAETADLAELGVPEWAIADAQKAEPKRKLEGLIAPGVYDVKPGWDAQQLLTAVLETSTLRLQAAGLPDAADGTGFSPYQLLIIASLVEREAVRQDFEKVARVIYNRIAEPMRLQFDSTVNYVLDRPEVRTTEEDRLRAGPYNTYRNLGLPPTPISMPSLDAITAAERPAQGAWVYFVKCEANGLSCFAVTYDEHRQYAREAQARGVY
ncbi:endolytic transglycosylase MltG [Saccharomonospora sp. NPDC046836]|uniref:endolytic transglycosylase MltG n=1 Tax=Saccharomonospora sp. NPDC046836 TaxID=3156921 RepID=UPI0033E54D56